MDAWVLADKSKKKRRPENAPVQHLDDWVMMSGLYGRDGLGLVAVFFEQGIKLGMRVMTGIDEHFFHLVGHQKLVMFRVD